MPARCVVGGCTAFPDVQKGIVLHAIPFHKDDFLERRECGKKCVDFLKQEEA